MKQAAAPCPHCGAPIELGGERFCCPGCAHAWEIIHEAGLAAYYERREATPDRPMEQGGDWSAAPVRIEDGHAEVQLQIDGLRCASCVWVTEHVLGGVEGVESAAVSYASGRARLRWDTERTSLPELASLIASLGYRPRLFGEGETWDRGLLLRLGFAAFATMNIMLLSASLYAGWASSMDPRFVSLFQWTSLALAAPLAIWAGAPFFQGAFSALRRGVLHMDLPIALAIALMFGHGVVVTAFGAGDAYLDSLGMLVTLLLAGRVLEGYGRRRTVEAAASLAASLPRTARRIRGEGHEPEEVPIELLGKGDRIVVGLGGEVPVDGRVVSGEAELDTALFTGESRATRVEPGAIVLAGSLVLQGGVEVLAEACGEHTEIQRMAAAVRDAAERPGQEGFADRLAPAFTAVTLFVAGLTGLAWSLTAGPGEAVPIVVAVLVVACPCALALAHPLVGTAGIGALARRGLLLRGPDVLERLASIDRVALDKTGTVTIGRPAVDCDDDEVLRVAAGLERYSQHPIAVSILDAARARGIPLPASASVVETPGWGVEGIVRGVRSRIRAAEERGRLIVERHQEGEWARLGTLGLRDRVRTDSASAVRGLHDLGLVVALISGDHVEIAEEVGDSIGVDMIDGAVRPEGKTDRIEGWTSAGDDVLFVGDGVNDAPALAAATVGLAMRSGADSTILTADGVLSAGGLAPLPGAIAVARYTERATRRAQHRSLAYNVIAVAAAALGGVNPLVAAILMPLSSSLVLASAVGVERFAAQIDNPPADGSSSRTRDVMEVAA